MSKVVPKAKAKPSKDTKGKTASTEKQPNISELIYISYTTQVNEMIAQITLTYFANK